MLTTRLLSSVSQRCICRKMTTVIAKPKYMEKGQSPKKDKAYILLVIPAVTFGLGVWQIKRREQKLELIDELHKRTIAPKVDFPSETSELKDLEYHAVNVIGTFDHSKEAFVGPRNDLSAKDDGQSFGKQSQTGFHVITPLILSDRNMTILVNRGWVPRERKLASTRQQGQIEGPVEFTGVVRHTEKRQQFAPENIPAKNQWFYRDLEALASYLDTEAILVDADRRSTVPGGPLGGQTRVTLRNEHASYIFTWFTLSALTLFGWYNRYGRR